MISQSCVQGIISAATTKSPKIQIHSGWAGCEKLYVQ